MQELLFEELKEFIQDYAKRNGEQEANLFEDMGMFLHSSLSRWNYFCTPINSTTFASTGGDGVHYGYLNLENSPITPVVMTIPMASKHNIILGESLHEFMRLGARCGYFALEELAYDRAKAITKINESCSLRESEIESLLLVDLIRKFELTAWGNIDERLKELERKYVSQIVVPDFDEWQEGNKVI